MMMMMMKMTMMMRIGHNIATATRNNIATITPTDNINIRKIRLVDKIRPA